MATYFDTGLIIIAIFCSVVNLCNSQRQLGTWKPDANNDECGKELFAKTVVGGRAAEPGEFPYMALLGMTQWAKIRKI